MAYAESHEPYNYDSQDAYNTQPVRYIGYGNAPTITQQPPARVKQVQQPQPDRVMKRSKAESLALVSRLKKWIVAASIVSFGTLSFLVAGDVVGVTSHTSTTSSSSSTSSKSSTTVTTPSQSSTNNSNGSYFQQGQSQSQSNQGGYGFGNNSSSSQGAVSSSSTS